MTPDTRRWLLLILGVLVGYAVLMLTNPARPDFRDGGRCVRRYRRIWLVPAGFGVAHATFSLWVRVYEAWSIPEAPPVLMPWTGWQAVGWSETLTAGALPAAEGTTSLFNCLVSPFPLSALWAGLVLGNWRGYQAGIYRALNRRFGRVWSLVIHGGFLVCAVAALCKPFLFGGLPRLNAYLGEVALLRSGEVVNTLSFFFEYLLGVTVQIYLVLLVFAWVRGLSFDFDGLRRFALRRFAFVVKWAALVLGISALGINLPLVLVSFRSADAAGEPVGVLRITRWVLVLGLLVFCAMQSLLIFHNESLRRATADNLRLWRNHGWQVGWFVTVAALHFGLLAFLGAFLPPAFGQWTLPAAVWNILVYPVLWGLLGGWLLASWICVVRRCESKQSNENILFQL